MNLNIILPSLTLSGNTLSGDRVEKSMRLLSDLRGMFRDTEAFVSMSGDQLIYDVSSFLPETEGTSGGLYFGVTRIEPGMVGDEYFMTKGHFHALTDRAEYYWGIAGEGVLILMDGKRKVWAERMFHGSLHYIPGGIAHRVANTGSEQLSFGACWPSDAGHNYDEIARRGFAARLREVNGVATLVRDENV